MKSCAKCGAAIDASLTTEDKNTGSQVTFRLQCFEGTFFQIIFNK